VLQIPQHELTSEIARRQVPIFQTRGTKCSTFEWIALFGFFDLLDLTVIQGHDTDEARASGEFAHGHESSRRWNPFGGKYSARKRTTRVLNNLRLFNRGNARHWFSFGTYESEVAGNESANGFSQQQKSSSPAKLR
jgi:hypothetical protein